MATMRGALGQDLVNVTNYSKKQSGGCRHLSDDWDDLVIVRKQCFMFTGVPAGLSGLCPCSIPPAAPRCSGGSFNTHRPRLHLRLPWRQRRRSRETMTQAIHPQSRSILDSNCGLFKVQVLRDSSTPGLHKRSS